MNSDGRNSLSDFHFSHVKVENTPPRPPTHLFSNSSLAVYLILFCYCALLFAGCPLPTGEDWVEPVDATSPSYGIVIDYNLQNHIPVPVAGASPTWSLVRGDMEVSVVWKDSAGNSLSVLTAFTEGTEYQAEITLARRNNHAFDPGIVFTYPTWMVKNQKESRDAEAEGRRVVAVTYIPAPAQALSQSTITIPLPFISEN